MKPYVLALLCLALTTLIVSPTVAAGVRYRVIDLGRMRMSTYMIPVAINNLGQIAGWEKGKTGASFRHGFLWLHSRFTDLGQGAVFALNNHGDVVGRREKNLNNAYQAEFRSYYRHAGKTTVLAPEYGSFDWGMDMVAVNDNGYVLFGGTVSLWRNGHVIDSKPGSTDQARQGYGQALNNRQEIAGFGQHGDVVLWTGDAEYSLIPAANEVESTVTGLNDSEQAIGWMDHPSPTASDPMNSKLQAFLTSKTGTQVLPLCAGDAYAVALGINAEEDVVGKSGRHGHYSHAVLWQNGQVIDLNDRIPAHSGWILESAHAINDRGQIVGVGTHNGKHFQAFLLTPVH